MLKWRRVCVWSSRWRVLSRTIRQILAAPLQHTRRSAVLLGGAVAIVVNLMVADSRRNYHNRLPPVGSAVPDFDLPMIGGDRLTPARLRGRPGVLALWSTDCSASRLALSGLAAVQEAYAARGVSVTILANDADTRMLESFMNRAGVNLPVAYAAGKLQALFGTARRPWHKGFPLPSYIVLNSAGRVTAVEIGVPLMDVQTGEVQLEHLRTALDRALTAMM